VGQFFNPTAIGWYDIEEISMGLKYSNRKYIYRIVWTFFCLFGGYIAATLLIPVSAPAAKTTPLITSSTGSFFSACQKGKTISRLHKYSKGHKGKEAIPPSF